MKCTWWVWLSLAVLVGGVALVSDWSRSAPVEPFPEDVFRDRVLSPCAEGQAVLPVEVGP